MTVSDMPAVRVALVTGAAHGLGRSFASALSGRGLAVAMVDVDADALARAAAELAGRSPGVLSLAADVTDEAAVERSVTETVRTLGRLDVLVNDAGLIFDVREPVERLGVDRWRRSLEVNATGTFLMCRAAIPHLRASGSGRIVNVTSGLVASGAAGRAHYVSAKAAVVGLTRCLARELGPDHVTVNALAPGLVDSGPRARRFVGADVFELEERRRCVPERMLPEDLHEALLFLVSVGSRFVTGQVITVDGGATMAWRGGGAVHTR